MTAPILAYHGTDRAFTRFDPAHIRAYNLGLHFGTHAAAEARRHQFVLQEELTDER